MGRRISNLPAQPELQEDDYLVVDGEDGTRKVPIDQSIVLSGLTSPTEDQGILGSMYVQYMQNGEIASVYFKTPGGWVNPPAGGAYVKEIEITEGTYSHNTITVVED